MGVVLIFNNEYFENNHRHGSLNDVQLLKDTFHTFNFRVKIVRDPSVQDIRKNMKSLLKEDLSTALCLIVVVMSHGGRNDQIYARDGPYNIVNEIINSELFKKWEDLPKIVITQACKADLVENGTVEYASSDVVVLRIDSTFERQLAYRSEAGSPFIFELCDNLSEYGHDKTFTYIADQILNTFESKYPACFQNPTKFVKEPFPSVCPGKRVNLYPDTGTTSV